MLKKKIFVLEENESNTSVFDSWSDVMKQFDFKPPVNRPVYNKRLICERNFRELGGFTVVVVHLDQWLTTTRHSY